MILIGLFLDPKHNALNWTLFGIAAIVAIIILIQTAGAVGWSSGYWWHENWQNLAGIIFILIIVGIIVGSSSTRERTPLQPYYARP